jgi:uncharacterized protein (TIGR03086 family)
MSENQTSQLDGPQLGDPRLEDPRPWYARAREQMAGLVAAVGSQQLGAPTPCAGFDLRDLLGHILGGCDRWALLGEGGDGLALEPMVQGVPAQGWSDAYGQASARVARAWAAEARMEAPVAVPWGTAPGRLALTGYVLETVTHAWDLARALGGGAAAGLDQELAEFALGFAIRMVPEERPGGAGPFGPARPVGEDAAPYDRLAAWLGREPDWSA